ncbi:ABC transporter permease [bacterium]|nr:ABC transporter permease [bacterium]
MWRNYFKIAARNISKHHGYSFLNIFGLALGMTCTLMILLWVQDELRYDRFHFNSKSLYRITTFVQSPDQDYSLARTPVSLASAIKTSIPGIKGVSRFFQVQRRSLKYNNIRFFENELVAVDPQFLRMFDFTILEGEGPQALTETSSIVLTEALARKYFGEEPAVGKIITLDQGTKLTVTAVLSNPAGPTHFIFSALIPFRSVIDSGLEYDIGSTVNSPNYTYIKLQAAKDIHVIASKINTVARLYHKEKAFSFQLQPLTSIHLNSTLEGDVAGHGSPGHLYLFSVLALIVLIIACINFMNLTTARSGNRAKEIGLRKLVGGQRKDLIFQFYAETIAIAFLALLLSMVLIELALPFFNQLTGKNLIAGGDSFKLITVGGILVTLVTGLLAGSYPALFITSFKPITLLKGALRIGPANLLVRRVLVVVQFSLAISLISSVFIVSKQLDYMQSTSMDIIKEDVEKSTLDIALRQSIQGVQEASGAGENVISANRPASYNDLHSIMIDSTMGDPYDTVSRIRLLLSVFTIIAMILSCIGLYGLALFLSQQRFKEIGIRKVLGASMAGITVLMLKECIQWIVVAAIISLPVAYLLLDRWLSQFQYYIPLSVWIFVQSTIIALVVAIITVSSQVIRSAMTNPAHVLQQE